MKAAKLTVVDGKTESVSTIDVDKHLWGIAADQGTKRIYLTGSGSAKLWVIDEKTNAVTSVDTGEIPCAVAVDSLANRLYVVNYGSNSVTVIDRGEREGTCDGAGGGAAPGGGGRLENSSSVRGERARRLRERDRRDAQYRGGHGENGKGSVRDRCGSRDKQGLRVNHGGRRHRDRWKYAQRNYR